MLGLIYPLAMTGIAQAALSEAGQRFARHRERQGRRVGDHRSALDEAAIFSGRPSAAGKGYDPTSTGGTNLGPTSKKLIDATKATIAQLEKENPDASGPPPIDLVTSSASGIDPDITPGGRLLGGAARRKGAPHEPRCRQRDRRAARARANVRVSRRTARQRPRTQSRAGRAEVPTSARRAVGYVSASTAWRRASGAHEHQQFARAGVEQSARERRAARASAAARRVPASAIVVSGRSARSRAGACGTSSAVSSIHSTFVLRASARSISTTLASTRVRRGRRRARSRTRCASRAAMRPARAIIGRSTSREPTASSRRSNGDAIALAMARPQRFAQRELAQREEVLGAEEVRQRRFDAIRRIDLAFAQALAQRLGRDVDEDHLVGEREDAVGQRFAHDRSGEPQDRIAQAFEMLDVQRRDHVDAGAQDGQHVVEALRRDRTGRVGVRQLVDQRDLRMCAR